MKSTQFDDVATFNTKFGHAVRDKPSLYGLDIPLRLRIHLEETNETALNFLQHHVSLARTSEDQHDVAVHNEYALEIADSIRLFANEILDAVDESLTNLPEAPLPKEDRDFAEREAEVHKVEVLDGLADSLVTLFGFAQATGMPILEAFEIVHASNMDKLGPDGKPVYFTEGPKKGKIGKREGWVPPTEKLRDLLS